MNPTQPLAAMISAAFLLSATASPVAAKPHSIRLSHLSTTPTGRVQPGAAEIVAHDPATQRLFVVNAPNAQVEVVDISNPAAPVLIGAIDAKEYGAVANSVAVKNGLVAIAVEANPKTEPGSVVFFDSSLQFLAQVQVGALPDMVTFTPDGRYLLTADEGEPSADYAVDPEGTVSIIDLAGGMTNLTVRTVRFTAFNAPPAANQAEQDAKVRAEFFAKENIRVYGPNATVAQDFEPEYVAVSQDSKTAWVTLQENNALAIIDIPSATVRDVKGLGTKDHLAPNHGLDGGDRDNAVKIANWPVKGLYLPDAIAAYRVRGQDFVVLANEGDAREYDGFNEEARIGSNNVKLDPTAFPNATTLKSNANLGRLKITNQFGDSDRDGDYDALYTFGARSFSIRAADGRLVWDSKDAFEQITKSAYPAHFNASHSESEAGRKDGNVRDLRSDDKGPEPESVTIGKVFGSTYAFIGLERIGGIMVYDISEPAAPSFVQYLNHRDFTKDTATPAALDLGPEGVLFISEENSPSGQPLVVTANEVSGTTSIFVIEKTK